TVIQGNGPIGSNAVRCVYLTNGAVLMGFTLTNGATLATGVQAPPFPELSGGGVWCAVVDPAPVDTLVASCILVSNSAWYGGGAAWFTKLTNCTLIQNFAVGGAGGAFECVLDNCLLSSNSVTDSQGVSGGAHFCNLNNCKLVGNSAPRSGGG